MNDMLKSMSVAASGLQAQGTRLRVISENLANANSTSEVPGGDPYRRKTVTFAAELDKAIGAEEVSGMGHGRAQRGLPQRIAERERLEVAGLRAGGVGIGEFCDSTSCRWPSQCSCCEIMRKKPMPGRSMLTNAHA